MRQIKPVGFWVERIREKDGFKARVKKAIRKSRPNINDEVHKFMSKEDQSQIGRPRPPLSHLGAVTASD